MVFDEQVHELKLAIDTAAYLNMVVYKGFKDRCVSIMPCTALYVESYAESRMTIK